NSSQAKSIGPAMTLRAHKLILTQWLYFKTMFGSGFSESGQGEKQIRAKDIKIKTFELLLRFMSMGRLTAGLMPETTCSEELETEEDDSVEALFMAAH
ncbi:hypothetical protein BG005_004867, partial [Podila minutissima]